MKISAIVIITIKTVAVLSLIQSEAACSKSYSGKKQPVAVKGMVDLREWDFNRDGPVDLSGEWLFHWNRLLSGNDRPWPEFPVRYIEVPGIWNGRIEEGRTLSGDGCATYRLKVLLPVKAGTAGTHRVALKVQDMGTAYSLFIDGYLAGTGGVVGESPEKAFPGYWPDVVEYATDGSRMEIMLHISNFHHRKGGAWEKIVLGTAPMLHDIREKNLARDFFLFGSIFLMGAYHLVLFSLRKKDRSYLFFGIFCMLIAVRVLVTGEYYAVRIAPWIPWEGILKTEYLSFYAGVPAFFLFVRTLFPAEFSRKALCGIVVLGMLFCCAVIVASSGYYTHTMRPYQVLSAVICLYGLFALIRAVARKREGSLPFTAGFIIMFVTVLNDFFHNNMIIQTGYLVPCGLMLFIILQAFLLSQRFSRTLSAVEHLTGELERKNRKLVDMDKTKDEFLAAVSHELRMPLNGIIGIAESMIDGRCGMLSLESKFNLGLINASGRRLAALVNDILDFTRLKNCDIALIFGPLDMKALVDVVFAFIRPLVGTKNLALINSIAAGGPLVCADEDRVQQVLYNVVGNAVKCTCSGSVVITARAADEKGWMEISITDTGTSIQREMLAGICMNHERDGSGLPGDRTGAEIGLSITRKLVELHGGSIRAESASGGGSVFAFTLPLWLDRVAEKSAGPLTRADTAEPDSSAMVFQASKTGAVAGSKDNGNLLVVDDDIVNIQIMRNYLSADGFAVEAASSGAEALDRMRQDAYDCVLLDLMMPGMSGIELCAEVRKRFSLVELPVIILTARHGITDLIAGFEDGANDYLAKPIHRDELLARVRTLVALKRTVRDHDEAKNKLLQERMNPHFLFNSLNTVHALINKDRSRADQAVIMLADNYRFLIDYSFLSLIPFDTEWQFVENYLELEELRFRDSLSTCMERHGDFSSIRIPPLTLQPLVENALKHGIRESGGLASICVFAESDRGFIRIAVRDNGAGPGTGDVFSRSLGNIRKRLNYYYHDVELAVENTENGGAMVRMSFFCGTG